MAEAVAVRWPHAIGISPTVLKSYQQCPYRTRLKYIDKVRRQEAFSIALEAGKIAHSVLSRNAYLARARMPFMDEAWCRDNVRQRLPRHRFPSPEAHDAYVERIVDWIGFGLQDIDPAAEFLNIERQERRKARIAGPNSYEFNVRTDLVLLRTDVYGEQVVEFIDFKTGKPWDDDITPLLARYIKRTSLEQRFGSTSAVRMRWVWSWLDVRQRTVIEMDRDYYERQWPLVSGKVKSLVTESVWPARPSKLCAYCPYRGNPCQDHGEAPEF